MTRSILLLAAAGLALPAAAQWPAPVERALSRAYQDCMAGDEVARGVRPAMRQCSGDEYGRQDARLNQAYRMTMQRLSRARQVTLRTSQRAWIARRDAICRRAAARYEGGTMAPLEQSQCAIRETIARRLWLERYR